MRRYSVVTVHNDQSVATIEGLAILDVILLVANLDDQAILSCTITPEGGAEELPLVTSAGSLA